MSATEVVEKLLTHHGVKGMKWGIRKDRSSSVSVSDKGKKLKTRGGFGHPAHPDAVGPRISGQIAKKSGVKALSDQQLNDYAKRLRLEQEVQRLQFGDKSQAEQFIRKALLRQGNQSADKLVTPDNAKKVATAISAMRIAAVAA